MSSPVRVLHILPRFVNHGAEHMAVYLMVSLDRARFAPAAISLYDRGGWHLEEALEKAQIPVWYLGKHRGFDPRMFARVGRIFKEFQPHLAHTHLGVLRYVLPAQAGKPFTSGVHTVHSLAEKETEPGMRWVQKLAFRRGMVPVAVSQEVQASMHRVYGLKNCAVIPNGIPLDRYQVSEEQANTWRKLNGFRKEDLLLACVGRFDAVKNHSYLLDAFSRVPIGQQSVHLLLAGEGALEAELRRQTSRLNLSSRVHFLGYRSDVSLLLRASDLFVLSSKREGNPLCVLEAMASGLPTICTAVGGLPELVRGNVDGLVVSLDDPEGFANAIQTLIDNPNLRRQMSSAAAMRAQLEFSLSTMVHAYTNVYDRLSSSFECRSEDSIGCLQ